jgi:diguanylate cyclase (GGDEF)-like protein/PAS domain S-box-containing protein
LRRLQHWKDRLSALQISRAIFLPSHWVPPKRRPLRSSIESAPIAILALRPTGEVALWNPAAQRMFGWRREQVVGKPLPIVLPAQAEEHQHLLQEWLSGESCRGMVVRCRKQDGCLTECGLAAACVHSRRGNALGVVIAMGDLASLRQREAAQALLREIDCDAIRSEPLGVALISACQGLEQLLGPPAYVGHAASNPSDSWASRLTTNTHAGQGDPGIQPVGTAALHEAVAGAQRGSRGSLVLLGVDNFEALDYRMGRAAREQLLAELASLLRSVLRPRDQLLRLNEDTFAMLLEAMPPREARTAAGRFHRVVAEHRFHVHGRPVEVSISLGIAPVGKTLSPEAIVVLADAALYRARRHGSSRIAVYEPDQFTQSPTFSAWVGRIRDALRENRFILQFQPIVRLDNAQVQHFEALIRWRDDDNSIVLPVDFLPVAEQCGLMPEIDRWVIKRVAELLRHRPAISVCINLSAEGLKDRSLLEFAENHLREVGVEHSRIVFEITESTAIENLHEVERWMRRLRRLGCRFALDDFGVGFSSLSRLRALPADYVKIAGTFVRNIDVDPTNLALVQAIQAMAHTLGKQVIAEWVETPAVAKKLQALGVEMGQGYYWGKPTELDML